MEPFGSSPPLCQGNVAMATRSALVDAYHAHLPAAERKALVKKPAAKRASLKQTAAKGGVRPTNRHDA